MILKIFFSNSILVMASQSPQIPELTPEYLQLLDPLKNIWLFIIQPKVDGECIKRFPYYITVHSIKLS